MITQQQLNHYNTFGFIHLPQLFTEQGVRTIRGEAETLWQAERGHRQIGY